MRDIVYAGVVGCVMDGNIDQFIEAYLKCNM